MTRTYKFGVAISCTCHGSYARHTPLLGSSVLFCILTSARDFGSLCCDGGTWLQHSFLVSIVALFLPAVLHAQNQPQSLYSNGFEANVGSEWSMSQRSITPVGNRSFLGEFGLGEVTLTLRELPPHEKLGLTFDLFILRSWDGIDRPNGPDYWVLNADGRNLLSTTFSNIKDINGITTKQSYPNHFSGPKVEAQTGAAETNTLGYTFDFPMGGTLVRDAVYNIRRVFEHSKDTLSITFYGQPSQPLYDESWGLDNVKVCNCSDVVRNSVYPQPTVSGGIQATFTPNFGYTLKEAADLCGVKSFNWIQTYAFPEAFAMWTLPIKGQVFDNKLPKVAIDDAGVPFYIKQPLSIPFEFQTAAPQDQRALDPIVDGASNMYVATIPGDNTFYIAVPQLRSDDLPFVWGENPNANNYVGDFTTENSLNFEDEPSIGNVVSDKLGSTAYVSFRTSLVGVREDGTFLEWSALGTNFDWKSNRQHLVVDGIDVAYLLTLPSESPPYFSGGVFDVRLDNLVIPEPSTHAAAILASIATLIFGHSRRFSSHHLLCSARATLWPSSGPL